MMDRTRLPVCHDLGIRPDEAILQHCFHQYNTGGYRISSKACLRPQLMDFHFPYKRTGFVLWRYGGKNSGGCPDKSWDRRYLALQWDAYQRQHHLQLWELQLLCDYRPPKQYGFPNFVGGAENPTDNLRCFFPDCG